MKGKDIANLIYSDFVLGMEDESKINLTKEKLNFIIQNNMGELIRIEGEVRGTYNESYVVSLFASKYSKEIRKAIKKNRKNHYDGEEASCSKKIEELLKYRIPSGVYYIEFDPDNYGVLYVTVKKYSDNSESCDMDFYIIGLDYSKYVSKYEKLLVKYYNINEKESGYSFIFSVNSIDKLSYPQQVMFKQFHDFIFKDKKKLIQYIDNWKNNIPIYFKKYGIVPKLSILLYGTPGTGKSSMYQAIADYLNIKAIRSYKNAGALLNATNRSGTFSVIDEIDLICGSREKDETEKLKNTLDFLDNPPTGRIKAGDGKYYNVSIVVATTNHYDKLDPALKRHGRFDLQIELKDFDLEDAEEMCKLFHLKLTDIFDEKSLTKDFTIQPSKLQALCLQNINYKMKGRN